MDDLISDFLVESYESLDHLDRDLVALGERPDDRELIAGILRTMHTIKGTGRFLGFTRLERVAHVGEDLISKLRDGELRLDESIATSLLATVDAVRGILEDISLAGTDEGPESRELIEALDRFQVGPTELAPENARLARPTRPGTSIRVDVDLLDKLVNLVGELVLARNQILRFGDRGDAAYAATTQRLNHITSELQEGVMKTRMQPIGNVWDKLPQLVRDLSVAGRKRVRVETDGKETELDRTLIEAITDPLMRLVRNAVDHGIEGPQERADAGKPEEGLLHFRAYHEGGRVNIEITDDGGGIRPERVKRQAIENNVVTGEQAARMSDRELVDLIFMPGYSTAEPLPSASAAFAEMDVVRAKIEKLGGSIDAVSRVGQGTTMVIKIPLTLAIIPALTVSCGEDRFAIPQASLIELVRVTADELREAVELVHDVPVYRLRGKLLNLVDLRCVLGMDSVALRERRSANMVVLQVEGRRFGLIVDDINDSEEIVVKPLGTQLKSISTFSGATILGDGQVALILDVMGVAARGGVSARQAAAEVPGDIGTDITQTPHAQTFLIFEAGEDTRMALRLNNVARLEEIPVGSIERSGPQEVVHYRGEIMPIVRLCGHLGVGANRPPRTAELQVVVHQVGARHVGLVVDRILDIIDVEVDVDTGRARPGVSGAAFVNDRVTEILDVAALIEPLGLFAGEQGGS